MGAVSVMDNRLYKLEDIVKNILEVRPITRDDDFELVSSVYEDWLGYGNYTNMSFKDLMENHIALALPPFASITRCRRKLQMDHPELRPSKEVAMIKTNETATYIEYALDI